MASAWGDSWGDSWGTSWEISEAPVVVTTDFHGRARAKRKRRREEILRTKAEVRREPTPPKPEPTRRPEPAPPTPPVRVDEELLRRRAAEQEEFDRRTAEMVLALRGFVEQRNALTDIAELEASARAARNAAELARIKAEAEYVLEDEERAIEELLLLEIESEQEAIGLVLTALAQLPGIGAADLNGRFVS